MPFNSFTAPIARAVFAALAAASVSLALPTAAMAQSLLDKIEAQVDERSSELDRVDALLADPAASRRIAAMEALLASGDPEFVNRARVVGLTSDDPRLRAAALKATFDAGGVFRAEFDIPDQSSDLTKVSNWLSHAHGSWSADGRTGYYPVTIGKYLDDKQCWEWLNGRGRCVFSLAGEVVHTVDWNHSLRARALLKLDDQGTLTGSFLVDGRGKSVTMRIPLIN